MEFLTAVGPSYFARTRQTSNPVTSPLSKSKAPRREKKPIPFFSFTYTLPTILHIDINSIHRHLSIASDKCIIRRQSTNKIQSNSIGPWNLSMLILCTSDKHERPPAADSAINISKTKDTSNSNENDIRTTVQQER